MSRTSTKTREAADISVRLRFTGRVLITISNSFHNFNIIKIHKPGKIVKRLQNPVVGQFENIFSIDRDIDNRISFAIFIIVGKERRKRC